MCVLSFVTFRCVFTKPYAFFEKGQQQEQQEQEEEEQHEWRLETLFSV